MKKSKKPIDWTKLAKQLREMEENERKEVIHDLAMATGIVCSDFSEQVQVKK